MCIRDRSFRHSTGFFGCAMPATCASRASLRLRMTPFFLMRLPCAFARRRESVGQPRGIAAQIVAALFRDGGLGRHEGFLNQRKQPRCQRPSPRHKTAHPGRIPPALGFKNRGPVRYQPPERRSSRRAIRAGSHPAFALLKPSLESPRKTRKDDEMRNSFRAFFRAFLASMK